MKFTVYLWIYCVNPWIKHTTVIIYLDKAKYLCWFHVVDSSSSLQHLINMVNCFALFIILPSNKEMENKFGKNVNWKNRVSIIKCGAVVCVSIMKGYLYHSNNIFKFV